MKKRFFRLIIQITFLAVTGLSLFIFLVWVGFFGPVPKESDLSNIKNNLATEIFSADGVLLGRYYLQERSKTQFKEIPESVQNALIATEDVRFYSHNGIDTRSMMRVLFKTIALQNSRSGGGSTLSQQLSRNIFPREEHGLLTMPVNKVKEAIMAYRLEKIYDKEEILTLYLNTVSFGDNVFGIGMASQRFYGKHVSKLTVDEAAVLVGMLKSNYYYNPRLFPQNALKRRNVVLSQMKKYDYLSQHEFGEIAQLPIRLNYKKEAVNDGLATYFRQQVRKEVLEWCKDHKKEDGSSHNLYTDGLKIYTTIDSKLQRYAEKAVKEHMTKLQKVFDNHWKNTKPWTKEPTILETAIRNSDHYNKLKSKGNSHEKIIEAMREKHPMTLFSWSGDIERDMSSIDSIKYYLNVLQTGVLAMEPNTGDVKVWVGGIDHRYFQYDHVNKNTKRQVGSTFKPFVYAAALESGMDPCEYISGSKVAYTNLANWTPDNADTEENKMKYSYKGALAKSVNTVTVKLL
ncbi:MAG: transglycosylase domain-containing protein, partial [Bacteroidota bacterium]